MAPQSSPGVGRDAVTDTPLTVGAAARAVGCSPATVRLWERQGLLHPVRTPSGYRLYDRAQLARLRRIVRLRSVDRLNAVAIRRLLSAEDGSARRQSGSLLGPRLRALRLKHKMTLAQAAAKAALSVSFLSALEKGDTGVSVATLRRILSTYGSTLAEMSASRSHGPRQLTRASRRSPIRGRFDGVRIEQLAESPALMEAQVFEIDPGASSEGGYSHDGEEFVYVLEGVFDVKLGASRATHLAVGDCLYFASTTEHSWRNPGRKSARLLWVNTPPTF